MIVHALWKGDLHFGLGFLRHDLGGMNIHGGLGALALYRGCCEGAVAFQKVEVVPMANLQIFVGEISL